MRTTEIRLTTGSRAVTDITDAAAGFINPGEEGLLSVFVPHATCGAALMETGSGSEADLVDALTGVLPRDDRYRHSHGSRGHGADHVLPAFIAPSIVIPVSEGRMLLGTWQRVVIVDTNSDNPERRVRLSLLRG